MLVKGTCWEIVHEGLSKPTVYAIWKEGGLEGDRTLHTTHPTRNGFAIACTWKKGMMSSSMFL